MTIDSEMTIDGPVGVVDSLGGTGLVVEEGPGPGGNEIGGCPEGNDIGGIGDSGGTEPVYLVLVVEPLTTPETPGVVCE